MAAVKDDAMPACGKSGGSGKLGLKMREVRGGARRGVEERRKIERGVSGWMGAWVRGWAREGEREKCLRPWV